MKIRLLTPQRVLAPAGTEISVDDSCAALLIEIGAAEFVEAEPQEMETPEQAKPKRTARKKG